MHVLFMHEVSLARELVRLVEEQCEAHGYQQVLRIQLQLDAFSCAAPEALDFAFESLRRGRLARARLDIRQTVAAGQCSICRYSAMLEKAYADCPRCGGIMLPEHAEVAQDGAMRSGDIRVTELEVI